MTESNPCPMCRKPPVAEFAPFCSSRCSQRDLGRWLRNEYVIPGDEIAQITPEIEAELEAALKSKD